MGCIEKVTVKKRTDLLYKKCRPPKFIDVDKNSCLDKIDFSLSPLKTPEKYNKHLSPIFPSEVSSAGAESLTSEEYTRKKVECVFNEDLIITQLGKTFVPWSLKVFSNSQMEPYRFMFEKTQDRILALNKRMERLGCILQKRFNFTQSSHVTFAQQEPVWTVGRVCCCSEGRLNDKSIVLLPPLEISNGRCLELDVSKIPEFAVFPGQILGVEGVNSVGSSLLVSRVHQDARKQMLASRVDKLRNYADRKSLELTVACGPFTASDGLFYKTLDALIEVLTEEPPDILMLIGPFVDLKHPVIQSCSVEKSFEEIYENLLTPRFKKALSLSENLLLLIVPSLRDVHHDRIFPQPPFQGPFMHERLRYLSNPCTFSVNEIVIGVTATDVLFHLSKEEVFKQSEGVRTDRLGRLANHLIEQRSFYPLYPPAMEVNLETSRIDKLEMACTPDILILPSDMKFFAKIVNDSLAVNPGRLTKALSAGTYCQISVAGIDSRHLDGEGDETKISNNIVNRSQVKIMRI